MDNVDKICRKISLFTKHIDIYLKNNISTTYHTTVELLVNNPCVVDQDTIFGLLEYSVLILDLDNFYQIIKYHNDIFRDNYKLIRYILYVAYQNNYKDCSILYEMIKYLIDYGLDITFNNNFAIKLASLCHENILKLVIDNGGDVHVDNEFPICLAANHGRLSCVKLLVDYGVDPFCHDNIVMKLASLEYYNDIIKYMISIGADINSGNNFVLCNAIKNIDDKMIKTAINAGANINDINPNDIICLIKYQCPTTIDILVKYGLDISTVNFCSKIRPDRKKFVDKLISQGVDPTIIAYLSYACENG
ncbi:putative ankyrin repeat protein [Acanthamoeba polyphaga mimivirus]|uniref:Ankyrin repeat protein n=1 Tax=Acanthamoeba polyphaga mimivirus Kroon TaxID=3069720 RepID=A0A0G2Y3G2_9VIRU|nr:putative ankyrin repeat protein [Acanthamoeba polyphaga mimivirus]AKI80335.1 putative ankyrin repeat protein [Acanthamoeba polyphaga mimivirus Kroon]